jgi:alpha-beta hydrolase superfamily lysophospholipase
MMPAAKESWSAFAFRLSARGIASLAIDLRGHGASDGGPDGYKAFDDAAHQAKRLDVEAALAWLRAKASVPLVIAGASIGANLAVRALAEHEDIAAAMALSPGLDYRGVTTADAAAGIRPAQKMYLAASSEDARSMECLDALRAVSRAEIRRLDGAGHGTAMLEHDAGFLDEAVAWLSSAV